MSHKNLLFSVIMLLSASSTSAEPITIFGVNITMTPEKVLTTISERGLQCQPVLKMYQCRRPNDISVINLNFQPGRTYINFSCGIFDVCSLGMEKVARQLMQEDTVPVSTMEPTSWGLYWEAKPAYCGIGEDGDRLCVTDGGITIEQFRYGKSEPNFN
ncbi:hypothetical protein [Thiorhodovibrio frisius]|uniref:hypothetical protein n=1 Tax=Thiorhodovibrio frisius TaxID=631362 RepID=UPI00117C0466|nr:hypothetical protein [Thiorhodovibrio frisius]